MFCHKCGNQLPENVRFCHKCGARVLYASVEPEASNISQKVSNSEKSDIVDTLLQAPAMTDQTTRTENNFDSDESQFKAFVDNYIRTTTKFQSAEEVLNHKPLSYVSICFIVPIVLGFILKGPLGALVLGLTLGHTLKFIVGGILRWGYTAKTTGKFDGKVDTDELIQFLDRYLGKMYPYFYAWEYIEKRGLVLTLGASPAEINIGSLCGEKGRGVAIICIRPDDSVQEPEKMKYIFGTLYNRAFVSKILSKTFYEILQISDPEYVYLFRTVPVLQATMEYYLKKYRMENNNYVLP